MSCSAITTEAFVPRRWEQTQRAMSMQRVRAFGILTPKWGIYTKSLHLYPRELCRRGNRKILRVRGEGVHHGGNVFYTQQKWCTNEHTETVTACRGLGQTGSPALQGKVEMYHHTKPRSYLQLKTTCKGKMFCFVKVSHWAFKVVSMEDLTPINIWPTQSKPTGIF